METEAKSGRIEIEADGGDFEHAKPVLVTLGAALLGMAVVFYGLWQNTGAPTA